MEKDGWVKLYRSTLENPIVRKDGDHLAIWVYLLLNATHEQISVLFKGQKITLNPGQLITGRKSIAFTLHIDEYKVQRVLKTFENEQQIAQQMSNKNRLITVLNWSKYQECTQQTAQRLHNNCTTDAQQLHTNKNVKNVRMKEDIVILPGAKAPDRPSEIDLPLNDKSEYPIYEEQVKEWSELYPAVDVMQELRKMKGWLTANPRRKKTRRGITRFITGWLAKEQDKGRYIEPPKDEMKLLN